MLRIMDCEQARENLVMNQEKLTGTEVNALQRHLHECSPCNAYSAELKRLDSLCNLWEEVEPSPTFEAHFWQALEAQQAPPHQGILEWLQNVGRSAFGQQATALAAMLFLTIGLSAVVMRHRPTDDPPILADIIQMQQMMDLEEGELDKLKDFDVIANLDLLEHFDEVKGQLFPDDPARQGMN